MSGGAMRGLGVLGIVPTQWGRSREAHRAVEAGVPTDRPLRATVTVEKHMVEQGGRFCLNEEGPLMKGIRRVLMGALIVGVSAFGEGAFAQNELAIADGMKVSLEYILTLPDKSVADSNVGQEPITFVQGAHEIVPGLEKSLDGMKAGQKRRIEVQAQDAYGPYNNKLKQSVDKDKLPKDVKVGDILQASDNRLVKVLEVNDKKVLIDLNHPLAGKTLTFDVTILKVEKGDAADATEKKAP